MKTCQKLTKRAGALVLASALLATAACSDKVRVLNAPIETTASSAGNTAVATLSVGPYTSDAIVLVTANGRSRRLGGGPLTGLLVSIVTTPPTAIRAQDSTLGVPFAVPNFRASASYSFRLPKGATRLIRGFAQPIGPGGAGNSGTSVTLTALALEAR